MDDGANERLLVPYCGPPLQRGFETASIIRRNTDGADTRHPSFTPATPEVLFEGNYFTGELTGRTYDVAPDGQRFLMITEGGGAEDTSAAPTIIVVQNWFEELRRLVPTD